MHLAVDGSFWGGDERGVAVATRRLWSAYAARVRPPHVTVFAPPSCRPQIGGASLVPVETRRGAAKLAWQQLVLPAMVRARDVDVLYCPCYTAPLGVRCRTVVTVHDLIAWTHPRLAGWRNVLHFRALVGRAIRRAGAVCVPTAVVGNAIVERFNVSPRRVRVVPWGADSAIEPLPAHDAAAEVHRRFGVDEPFALFCGCLEPKKNVGTALRACAEAGLLLLIAGPSIAGSCALLAEAGRRAPRARYLGYVSTADLSALYSAATALVLPSYAEGFGLPALEAMRCGCPVIASAIPSLREVCADASLYAEPDDATAIAASLRRIARDRSFRESLIAAGTARARRFTWAAATDAFAEAVRFAEREAPPR